MKKNAFKPFLCSLLAVLLTATALLAGGCNKEKTDGPAWLIKDSAPTATTEGKIGDMWLNDSTSEVYQLTEIGWTPCGSVKDNNGYLGKNGASVTTGTESPLLLDVTGKTGGMYVNTANGKVYQMSKSKVWEYVFTLGEVDTSIKNASWYKDGELKILMIGNSFSDDTSYHLWKIAHSAGVDNVTVGNLYIGGCSIDTHFENATKTAKAYEYRLTDNQKKGVYKTTKNTSSASALQSENWDFVSFQQASDKSGNPSSFGALPELLAWAKNLCPDAQFVWNMTWAYQSNSTHSGFKHYNNDQTVMYNAIIGVLNARILTNESIDLISPTGTAIQNARAVLGDTATRDGYHLAFEGDMGTGTYNARYLAALTFFGALTGVSLDKVTYTPDNVDATTKAVLLTAASSAIRNPFPVIE